VEAPSVPGITTREVASAAERPARGDAEALVKLLADRLPGRLLHRRRPLQIPIGAPRLAG